MVHALTISSLSRLSRGRHPCSLYLRNDPQFTCRVGIRRGHGLEKAFSISFLSMEPGYGKSMQQPAGGRSHVAAPVVAVVQKAACPLRARPLMAECRCVDAIGWRGICCCGQMEKKTRARAFHEFLCAQVRPGRVVGNACGFRRRMWPFLAHAPCHPHVWPIARCADRDRGRR